MFRNPIHQKVEVGRVDGGRIFQPRGSIGQEVFQGQDEFGSQYLVRVHRPIMDLHSRRD